ncbi:MAG: hypothetical protein L6Q81_05075 [Bacteroidia bacterium]|nr:hypothetical protein [Bacteroidia bacterium]
MKTIYSFLIVSLVVFSQETEAQVGNEALTNVKAPASPSSSIIGSQPSTISRPKSWESLEASLFSNFIDSNNRFLIPDNYSLEFSPYWAMGGKISNKDFLTPSVGTSALQNLSVSISSTKSFKINDTTKTDAMGFGIRTMLWQGTKDEIDLINKKYDDAMTASRISMEIVTTMDSVDYPANCNKDTFLNILFNKLDAAKNNIFESTSLSESEQAEWLKGFKIYLSDSLPSSASYNDEKVRADLLDKLIDQYCQLDTKIDYLENVRDERKGFKLEVATAVALNFPNNRTDYSYGSKVGVWFTPSFQPFKEKWHYLEFLGVARYFWYNPKFYSVYMPSGKFFEHNIDYGFKLVLKQKKIALEMEATGRTSSVVLSRTVEADGSITKRTNTKTDHQLIATLTYVVNENISISYNFGRSFKPTLDHKGNLLSVATINFGLGAPKIEDLTRMQ